MDDSNDSGMSNSLLGSSVWSPSSLASFNEHQLPHKQTWSSSSSNNSNNNACALTPTSAGPALTTKQTLQCLEVTMK